MTFIDVYIFGCIIRAISDSDLFLVRKGKEEENSNSNSINNF